MTHVRRTALLITLVATFVFTTLTPSWGLAADPPMLTEQRFIEIPDSRIIGLSPDGSSIAAASFDMQRLCIYERDSLAERVCADLAPLEAGLRLEDVVWSPDSAQLVLAEQPFVRFVDGDLWLMDAASGGLTNLTDDGYNGPLPFGGEEHDIERAYVDVDPAWLPDGSGITFSRSTWRGGTWRGNTIETVPVTGGPPEMLTTVSTDEIGVVYFGMEWTADGSTLYYSVNHRESDDPDNGIWRINADGSGAEKMVGHDPELGAPALAGISPDGDTVLAHYIAATARSLGNTGSHLYSLLDVESGQLTPVRVDHPMVEGATVAWPATITPDGNHVLYVGRLTDPINQLLIRPVDGGEEIALVPDGIADGAVVPTTYATPAWSNDGSVLFQSGSPSTAIILTIDGVGRDAYVATPTPDAEPATPIATNSGDDVPAGSTVTVNDNDVPLRSAPGIAGQTVATLPAGTELTVVGPAMEADGHTWIPVTDPTTGTIGYIRAEFIGPSKTAQP